MYSEAQVQRQRLCYPRCIAAEQIAPSHKNSKDALRFKENDQKLGLRLGRFDDTNSTHMTSTG